MTMDTGSTFTAALRELLQRLVYQYCVQSSPNWETEATLRWI